MRTPATALLLLLISVGFVAAQVRSPRVGEGGASRYATVQVVSTSETGVVLRVNGVRAGVQRIGGNSRITSNAGTYQLAGDSNALPGMILRVGIPSDAYDIAATEAPVSWDSLQVDPLALQTTLATPQRITVGRPSVLRGLHLVPIEYHPMQLDGSRLRLASGATITVSWKRRGKGTLGGELKEHASVDNMLERYIVNFSQSRRWRMAGSSGPRLLAATQAGIGQVVVMQVGGDGLFRATGSQIAATGAPGVVGAPVSALHLTNRKDPVSIYVADRNGNGAFDADDYLEFVGRHNRGDEGFYLDQFADTNAYVLTWSAGPDGNRLSAGDGHVVAQTQITAYDSTLHFEKDSEYVAGIKLNENEGGDITGLHNPDQVKLERYYWGGVSYPFPSTFRFNCSPTMAPGSTVTLRFRMIGPAIPFTIDPNTGLPEEARRPIEVVLNSGLSLGTIFVRDTVDTLFEFAIPSGFLINGPNSLTLRPQPTQGADIPNVTYLDYIELVGRWQATTFDGQSGKLRMPANGGEPRRLTMTGFTAAPTSILTPTSHFEVDSSGRGFLFRITSRQFENTVLRSNAGCIVATGDTVTDSGVYSTGLLVLDFDPSGKLRERRFFNTYESDENKRIQAFGDATRYVQSIPNGDYVVAGFSVGFGEIHSAAVVPAAESLKSALVDIGARGLKNVPLSDLFVSSWAFAVRKGEPATAVERYGPYPQYNHGVTLNAFIPAPQGNSYTAVASVSAQTGAEITVGETVAPVAHYHDRDRLATQQNQAALIIVTHPNFMTDANRLAEHRRSFTKLPTVVADVTTIYDEFNDGVKSPVAIRRFLQYADENWGAPAPAYVLLLGNASTDPMFRNPRSNEIDYVPTLDNPVSDYLFTVHIGDTTLEPHGFIGRMPVSSVADARAVVDKLIDYDKHPPEAWNKRFVFLSGGFDSLEASRLKTADSNVAVNYILSRKFQGDTALVFRTSADLTHTDTKDAPWARSEINKGAVWVTFTGHGSPGVVDLDYGLPQEFDNGYRYFVLGTFSCQTGAFAATDQPARNELFITIPGKGAIATFGNTGYSWADIDNALKNFIYPSLTELDTSMTNLGALFTLAKYDMYFNQYRYAGESRSKDAVRGRNGLLNYSLLGDPSMNLVIRNTVELALPPENASLSATTGKEPGIGDTVVVVNARLWNYGKPVPPGDSTMVVATIIDHARNEQSDTLMLYDIVRSNAISLKLPLNGKPGEYTIRLVADPSSHHAESYRDDNVLSMQLLVRGNQPLPLEPLPFGRVAGYDDVVIRLLNPPSGPGAFFEVDTSDAFDSPARFTSAQTGSMKLEELTTTWTFAIPAGLRATGSAPARFWWRATATTGDTSVARLFPLIESFTVQPQGAGEYVVGGVRQMRHAAVEGLVSDESGVGAGSRIVDATINAVGQSRYENGDVILRDRMLTILIGDREYSRNRLGLNLIVFPPGGVEPKVDSAFVFYYADSTEQLNEFLRLVNNRIDVGDVVILGSAGSSFEFLASPGSPRRAELIAALKSIGVSVADSIGKEDSYAMIGGKGLTSDKILYDWKRRNLLLSQGVGMPYEATVATRMPVVPQGGSVTFPTVGPARVWRSVAFEHSRHSPMPVTVYGLRRDGNRDSLLYVPDATTVDLSGIDVRTYPRIQIRSELSNDTLERLRSTSVDFDPSPELAFVPSTFGFEQDSVLQGDPGLLHVTLVNLSRRYPADSFAVRLMFDEDNQPVPVDTMWISHLGPLDSNAQGFRVNTSRLRGRRAFAVLANPLDVPAEPYRQNNRLATALRVGLDSVAPAITIYADGNRMMNGDYVGPRPEFEVRIFDNSSLELDRTTVVRMIIDNQIVSADSSGARFVASTSGDRRGVFYYQPVQPLEEGIHCLHVVTMDATGNADTMPQGEYPCIDFYVERTLKVKQVVNWPNPFADKTMFTFMIGGATPPKSGEIAIFTVSGRKIKTIPLGGGDLNIGFNRVEWDGRDADGDQLANGVYLYRVNVNDGEATQEVIEKLVIMR